MRLILSLLSAILITFSAKAVMAFPHPVTITQPDGTELTLIMHGDEHCNFVTTADGYTVMQSPRSGVWEYASLAADTLTTSGITAHNEADRTKADTDLLLVIPRMLRPAPGAPTAPTAPTVNAAKTRAATHDNSDSLENENRLYDYSRFRGLVLLVEYTDKAFSRDDARDIFNSMLNERGFSGFPSDKDPSEKVPYTGSVCDYYFENSKGLFNPRFDLVGPVTVPHTKEYVRQVDNAQKLMRAALTAADSLVNYSDYDTNGDGIVDMVYFIFAGHGSNYTGNNTNLLWPHASEIVNFRLDGIKFGRYACSTELYGRQTASTIDGIGTICHEFSHVLGLPDLYDTDYSTNGQCVHPANWSVMASGSYLNNSKTPCSYSLYERYAVGFSTPVTITDSADYTLDYIGTSGTGYRIDSPIPGEFFLLENRLKTRWDQYLPGEGMLAFRVDSTDISPWMANQVNANAMRPYYELMRADPIVIGISMRDSNRDPYPGANEVTSLSLKTFSGQHAPLMLTDIAMAADGSITFTATTDPATASIAPTELRDLSQLHCSISGSIVTVTARPAQTVSAYGITGCRIATATADSEGLARLSLSSRGVYIITDGTRSARIVL